MLLRVFLYMFGLRGKEYTIHTAWIVIYFAFISQVIVMSGVSAASDIWSMGCTVIELLTCIPPYYDLQPMAALYRIVEVRVSICLLYLFKDK